MCCCVFLVVSFLCVLVRKQRKQQVIVVGVDTRPNAASLMAISFGTYRSNTASIFLVRYFRLCSNKRHHIAKPEYRFLMDIIVQLQRNDRSVRLLSLPPIEYCMQSSRKSFFSSPLPVPGYFGNGFIYSCTLILNSGHIACCAILLF